MRCGDRGHVTAAGTPCQQPINPKAAGCLHHDPTTSPEQKHAAYLKGALASRMRTYLPSDTPRPEFSSTETIVTWAQDTAHRVLCGELDPRAAAEARQLAALTIAARSAEASEKLVEALLRVEHGGAALVLLARLTDGLANGQRRPLPPRVLAAVPTPPREPEPAA